MNTQPVNMFSAHNRILEIISSCDTTLQLRACKRMIRNFRTMYPDYNNITLLSTTLKDSLQSKLDNI
jgi:hypothetical protein